MNPKVSFLFIFYFKQKNNYTTKHNLLFNNHNNNVRFSVTKTCFGTKVALLMYF